MNAKSKKSILKIGALALVLVLAIVFSYLIYVIATYKRIEDNQTLTVDGTAVEDTALTGTEYTIITQNLGFGAYTQDFTFFMDGGKESRAESKESVIECIGMGIDTVCCQLFVGNGDRFVAYRVGAEALDGIFGRRKLD